MLIETSSLKKLQRFLGTVVISILCLAFTGCSSVQISEYIGKADHPYNRTIIASFEKVSSAAVYVLKHKGWVISTEALPSLYERDERYDTDGLPNLLIMTQTKRENHGVYTTFTNLNIFIHSVGDSCDVEIRYESQKPMIKNFISTRNDRLVNDILDALQQEATK